MKKHYLLIIEQGKKEFIFKRRGIVLFLSWKSAGVWNIFSVYDTIFLAVVIGLISYFNESLRDFINLR